MMQKMCFFLLVLFVRLQAAHHSQEIQMYLRCQRQVMYQLRASQIPVTGGEPTTRGGCGDRFIGDPGI